jgi:hypothetical protein
MTLKIEGPGPHHPFPVVEKIDAEDDYKRGVVLKVWTRVEGQLASVDIFLNHPQADILGSTLSAYRERRQHHTN